MRIPMVNLRWTLDQTQKAWRENLERMHGRSHYILGPEVAAFEPEFAAALDAKHAVGVSNGTTAIELCLREANVKGEVITSALTAPFTGVAIQAAGATPVFADVDPETLLIDPKSAEKRIGKRTAALLPVHLHGQPCDLNHWRILARAAAVPLVQDACQAHGATWKGKPFSSYSPYVAYSFYPTKNLGCLGDGGAVVTSSPRIDQRLRQLRDGGRKNGEQVARITGINARLDEMQACYLRAFLPQLRAWNEQRAKLAALYDEAFANCGAVRPVHRLTGGVVHLYVIRVRKRDPLRQHLAGLGIATAIHYAVPLHLHPAFASAKQKRGDLLNAERAAKEIVSLPLWPGMTEAAIGEVSQAVKKFVGD